MDQNISQCNAVQFINSISMSTVQYASFNSFVSNASSSPLFSRQVHYRMYVTQETQQRI